MKPKFWQLQNGCFKIGINPFISGLTNKPVVRIEIVEFNEPSFRNENTMFTFYSQSQYEMFIEKLIEAKEFYKQPIPPIG